MEMYEEEIALMPAKTPLQRVVKFVTDWGTVAVIIGVGFIITSTLFSKKSN